MEAEYKYDKLPDSEKSKIKFLKYEHDCNYSAPL